MGNQYTHYRANWRLIINQQNIGYMRINEIINVRR